MIRHDVECLEPRLALLQPRKSSRPRFQPRSSFGMAAVAMRINLSITCSSAGVSQSLVV